MFWSCFTYDHKGPCHVYYPQTKAQIQADQDRIDKLNDEEIEDEVRAEFDIQEREKEANWDKVGKKWPTKRAS